MPRPSQNIDQRLLAAGRELFPDAGCAGLAVRAVADRAGVNPGMLHYHFRSKDDFLRALLQQMYEEMFATLAGEAAHDGPAIERLRAALVGIARFLRANRRTVARVWIDAMGGAPVAREFIQANAPRHVGLLVGLLEQAQREGALRELPPAQRLMVLLGGVALPLVFVAGLVDAAALPPALRRAFDTEVMDDAAIAQRVDLLIEALRAPPPARTHRVKEKLA
jgi:AcrR family transcriptional regulator